MLEDQAIEQRFERVRRIWLEIGPFSCVEPDALRFGFDAVMRGSLAEGADLEIVSAPGAAKCLNCGATVRVADRFALCPQCGHAALQVTAGDELRICKLEVV